MAQSGSDEIHYASSDARRLISLLVNLVSDVIPLLMWASVCVALLYGCTIAYGLAAGYALPTTAFLFLVPRPGAFVRVESALPMGVLLIAFVGTCVEWLSDWHLGDSARLRRNTGAAAQLLGWWGCPAIYVALLFAMSAIGWSQIQPAENYQNLRWLGLLPFSDSQDYFSSPIDQVLTGSWDAIATQRPFAAGFRHLTMAAAGFSYTGTILLQAGLISAALFAACRSIVLWRGLWSGLAFFAFIYVIVRAFLATVLTEPLGLIWALFSVMFLVEAMRTEALRHALLALACLTIAELIRMGSVFTVPAFVLWIGIAFACGTRDRLKLIAVGLAVVVLLLFIQELWMLLYGSRNTSTGNDFAYILCGDALGKRWQDCHDLYRGQLDLLRTDRDRAYFLYSKAVELALQNPEPFIRKLYSNAYSFVVGMPAFFLGGHGRRLWGFLALIPGWYLAFSRKSAHGEVSFWILSFLSMLVSASLILGDDGWRTMFSAWPLVALFICFGFASPLAMRVTAPPTPSVSAPGGVLLIAVVLGVVTITPAATRLWPGTELARLARETRSDDLSRVLVGRTVTGFVVIPDSEQQLGSVPSLRATQFIKLVEDTHMERDYGPFLRFALQKIPFAFITAAPSTGSEFYLVPTGILTTRAKMWRITLGNELSGCCVHNVVSIRPLQ